jgi:hypothetical protein
MSNNKASSALLLRIAGAALKEFRQDDLYVAQTPAGIALSDAHLTLLQELELDRLKDPSSVARLVELSQIVDCIQDSVDQIKTPAQSPAYLSDVFPRLINNVEFLPAPLSADDRRQYDQAKAILFEDPPFLKTAAYQEFCILRSELEKKEVVLAEMKLNLKRMVSSAEKAALESEVADLAKLCAEKKEALDAMDRTNSFSSAEAIIDKAERRLDEMPASVHTALDTMELLKITNPITNETHVACSFFPSQLSEDNWVPLKLSPEDIAARTDDGEKPAEGSEDIDDKDIESIELEIQTVVCERPWLWSALFNNQHWKWQVSSKPIATGKMPAGDTSLIPAYIHGLIFARNLMIKCKSSAPTHLNFSRISVRPTTGFLMRAITPMKLTALPSTTPLTMKPTVIPITRKPPMLARSAVSSAVVRKLPVGPAIAPLKRPISPIATTVVNRPVATSIGTKLMPIGGIVLRPGIFSKLFARGRVVDNKGQGIYQATVTLMTSVGERRITTGSDGSFTFSSLDFGRYAVSVSKSGFTDVKGTISVPQAAPLTIQMNQSATCEVRVRLLEEIAGKQQPFTAGVKLLIRSATSIRLESIEGRSEASFFLQPGSYTISATSPLVTQISPAQANIVLQQGQTTPATLTFSVSRAMTISNPEIQVLGFLCRKIPRSPIS